MRRAHDEVSRDERDNSEEEDGYNLRNKRVRLECSSPNTKYVSPYICKRVYRKKSPLIYLPNEIIQKVFTYISYEELGNNVRLVNKQFKQLAQELMNSTFKSVERRLNCMKKLIVISIGHSQDQMETKCFCKMLNILEFIYFHYTILHSTIWRHISNEYRPATNCMYGGLILDLYINIFQLYTKEPHKIYGAAILNDYTFPSEVEKLSHLTKIFVLYFDRVSEQGINMGVSCSGSKILDILDCAIEVKKDVQYQAIVNNILTYKVSYYFCNSWLVALKTKDERSMGWNEQMRLMYMRLRRIVVSHTEMQMEYAQYRRELDLIPSFAARIKKPVNSVYTGYGEVGEMFYYYGSMNEGAYTNKFSRFASNVLSPEDPEEENILNREGIVPFVGLSINVELKCTLHLAPLKLLKSLHWDTEHHEKPNWNSKFFDLRIDFDCAGASYARLPRKYFIIHVEDTR